MNRTRLAAVVSSAQICDWLAACVWLYHLAKTSIRRAWSLEQDVGQQHSRSKEGWLGTLGVGFRFRILGFGLIRAHGFITTHLGKDEILST